MGVTQGSILGPLLFVLFINDLPLHVHTRLDMFTDDTTLLASSDCANVEELKNTLSSEVSNVNEWATNNKLPLNCSKTKTILIDGPRLRKRLRNEDRKLEIELKGNTLEQVENVKLLGLELDEELSFDIHIDSLCKKISKRIGILNRIKAYLPRAERILYYNSLIKPLILYCSVTWTSCCSHDNLSKIFRLPKRCARVVLDTRQRHDTVDLFNTLGWVPYYIETDIRRCTIAHKRIMGACPLYINDLLRLNNSQHNMNTRGANFTILPTRFNRAKEGGRTFSVTTTKCWNHLPLKLRASSSVNILKNALYKHFNLSQLRNKVFTPFLDNNF